MINVRLAGADECGGVVDFYCGLIDSMRDSEFKPEWEMGVYPTSQQFQQAIDERTLFLAYLDDRLVGVMILNHEYEPEYDNVKWQTDAKKDEIMVIHLLGVSPAHQRKGVAKQMVSYVIELCGQGPIKAIRLDVLKKNIPASKLYLSMGFQFIEAVKIFYEDTGLTDFLLYELAIC